MSEKNTAGDDRDATEVAGTEALCSLPVVGRTTVEDAIFYGVTGAVAAVGWVSWPTAALFTAVHALHQRARNIAREGAIGEVRAGLLDAVDEIG